MSQIKTTEIEGDVAIGRHVTAGGNATIQGNATVKKNLKIEGWLDARNIKGPNKGIFLTAEKLREAYPLPHDGWWALVGNTLPAALYISDGGEWAATGESAGNPTIDSQQYNEAVAALDAELKEVESDVAENRQSISQIRTQINTIGGSVNTLTADVTGLKTRMTSAEGNITAIRNSQGQPNGMATLDENGLIPENNIPGRYDDVVEFKGFKTFAFASEMQSYGGLSTDENSSVFYDTVNGVFVISVKTVSTTGKQTVTTYSNWADGSSFGEFSSIGRVPQIGKVYVDINSNKMYRWSENSLVIIGNDLALGHTSDTAFPGDEGKATKELSEQNRDRINVMELSVQGALYVNINQAAHNDEPFYTLRQALLAVPTDLRSYGVVVTFLLADEQQGDESGKWVSYQWQTDVFKENRNWLDLDQWKPFGGGGAAVGNTFNVTVEIPLPDGEYYSDIVAEEQVHNVLQAVYDAGMATPGLQITFAIGPGSWKTYQYIGPNVTEPQFVEKPTENWIDLAGMSAGTEPVININQLCGDKDYTLSTAVQALIDYEGTSGINYRKEGLVITYRRDAETNTWETKQYHGSLSDMTATNEKQWKDFGGGSGSDVETKEEPEKNGKDAFSTGGAYKNLPTKNRVTQEDGVTTIQLLNEDEEAVGEPIQFLAATSAGGGEQSGTIVTVEIENTPLYGAIGGKIATKARIRSVTMSGGSQLLNTISTLRITDRDTNRVIWSKDVNKASSDEDVYDFELDFSEWFKEAGVRRFKVEAIDDGDHVGSRNITVTAVDATITCRQTLGYNASDILAVGGENKSLPMYAFEKNVSTEGIEAIAEMYWEGEWRELGRAVIRDNYTHNISINPTNVFGNEESLTHGGYLIRIYGKDIASGVTGNTIYTTVMAIESGNETPIVCIRWNDKNSGKLRLYDTLTLDIAAWTAGQKTTPVEVLADTGIITSLLCTDGKALNVSKQLQGYSINTGEIIEFWAQSGVDYQTHHLEATIEGSAIDAMLKDGALFTYDFAVRNNEEPNHTIADNGIELHVEGCNWNSNGFVQVLGENTLRIAENVTAYTEYRPFESNRLEETGMVIQLAFSTKNIKNPEAHLCECWDEARGAGFYITGNEVVITCKSGTPVRQGVRFKNQEKITIAVVVEPATKYVEKDNVRFSFVKLYVNGEECGAIGYTPGTSALQHSQPIKFNSAAGDIAINYMMVYSSHMEWKQAFDNYLCRLSDTESMVLEYDENNVLDSTGKPSLSLMAAKGIPYYVVVADQTTFNNFDYGLNGGTSTSDQFACTLYYYNPQHPEVNFKATNVLMRRQGTTSAQRPIKNERFNFNKKNKTTGLKATVTLLNPDETTELGRNAIKAAADRKVFCSETGNFIDVVTVKVDYSDSSNANDCGVCDMMNATFRALGRDYMTPAQRAFTGVQYLETGEIITDREMDHSTKNHPIAIFRATNENDIAGSSWFHAKGNWKEDKGEQTALGFKDTPGYNLGCLNYGDFVEYFGTPEETLAQTEARFKSDPNTNTEEAHGKIYLISQYCGRDYAIYRYKNGTWTRSTGSMKQVNGQWVVTGDVLNPVSGYELLQYSGMDWWQGVSSVEEMMASSTQKSSWVTKLGLPNETYPAWTFYFECMIDDDQLQVDLALGKKVPYELFNILRFFDSVDYSKEALAETWRQIWRENAYKYMSIESAMAYTAFTDYLAAVDQRAKNMQPMFFLEDGCYVENGVYYGSKGMEPTRMYLNKIYDCDTCNGADNDGGRDIDPEVDPNKPTDEESGYSNPYMGRGSVLFNDIDKEPEVWNSNDNGATTISLKSVVNKMRTQTAQIAGKTMVPFSPDGAMYFFVDKKLKFWPKVISSYDGERKYIDHTTRANSLYFYALHGLGLTSLPRFIEQRWSVRDGYYQCGAFFNDPLTIRMVALSTTSKIGITAAATGYFGIGNDAGQTTSKTVFLNKGESYEFGSDDFEHNQAEIRIYQANRLSRLDLSEMSLASATGFSRMSLCEELILGGYNHTSNPDTGFGSITNIPLGDMPFLEILDISGTTATGVDASLCPRLVSLDASETPLTSYSIAQTAPIETLKLPATLTSIELVNLPKLKYPGGLELSGTDKVTRLWVEGTPNIDVEALLLTVGQNRVLREIRASGLDVTGNVVVLQRLKATNAVGISSTGEAYVEPGQCSGLEGRWVMSDLISDDLLEEMQEYFVNLDIYNNRYTKVVFSDDAQVSSNISNEANQTGYKYGNAYVASGHVLKIRDECPICACRKVEGVMVAKPLSNDTLLEYRDGTPFDPTDAVGAGVDVMKYIRHFWYKGVNDFVNGEKIYYVSTNADKPVSTAHNVTENTVLDSIHLREYALLTSQNSAGSEPVLSANATTHVCRIKVSKDQKLLRWPGLNTSSVATVFVGTDGCIIKVFTFSNALSDFTNGNYLVAEIPEGTDEILMTVPKGFDTTKVITTDSTDKESVVFDWFEHKPELIGIYHGSCDGQNFLRSISGASIKHGDGVRQTSTEWQYDTYGNLTSMSAPTTMHWTMKDMFNAARVRGTGYQVQDYESWKDFTNLVMAITGTRDTQGLCGMGGSQNGYSTGGYDTLNPNGFSQYPSASGNPFKGNNVWGIQNYMSCGGEVIENVAVNVVSWETYKRNKHLGASGDPVNFCWHIWNEDESLERIVQGVSSSSGYCIGKMRWGDRCDIVPSQMTGDNSLWNKHYTDYYNFAGSAGLAVFRGCVSYSGAYAYAGLVGTGAGFDSSFSDTFLGCRLAFRGEIEIES